MIDKVLTLIDLLRWVLKKDSRMTVFSQFSSAPSTATDHVTRRPQAGGSVRESDGGEVGSSSLPSSDSRGAADSQASFYVVVCRGDREEGDDPAPYELATRTVFTTSVDAGLYARGINQAREPLVVEGRWKGLRFDAAERFGKQFS